jgi:hypothetical protein
MFSTTQELSNAVPTEVDSQLTNDDFEKENSTLDRFARNHHLKIRKDECGERIIAGRLWKKQPANGRTYGHHIFEHGSRLGVCLMFEDSPAKWTNRRRSMEASGFTIANDGYGEGIGLFEPTDKAQARLAIKLAKVRIRRVLAPEQALALANRLKGAREAKAA